MRETFVEMSRDIICHPLFQDMKECVHHGGENCLYDHCIDTARCAYAMARHLHLTDERTRSLTRAALLHDFFGYDHHSESYRESVRSCEGWDRIANMHAFAHGARAARRASEYFELDDRQRSAITSHMFPLAPMPRNTEGWILTVADKVVASREMSATVGYYMRRWYHKVVPVH